MTITITLGAWLIPSGITAGSLFYALVIVKGGNSGTLAGLDRLFALIPALGVSCIAWIVYAVLK